MGGRIFECLDAVINRYKKEQIVEGYTLQHPVSKLFFLVYTKQQRLRCGALGESCKLPDSTLQPSFSIFFCLVTENLLVAVGGRREQTSGLGTGQSEGEIGSGKDLRNVARMSGPSWAEEDARHQAPRLPASEVRQGGQKVETAVFRVGRGRHRHPPLPLREPEKDQTEGSDRLVLRLPVPGARQPVGASALLADSGEGAAVPGDGHALGGTLHRRVPKLGERAQAALRAPTEQGDVQSAQIARAEVPHVARPRRSQIAIQVGATTLRYRAVQQSSEDCAHEGQVRPGSRLGRGVCF
jgi:hypothetical protein